jgi:magnesium-transporting ATPase (P-type)
MTKNYLQSATPTPAEFQKGLYGPILGLIASGAVLLSILMFGYIIVDGEENKGQTRGAIAVSLCSSIITSAFITTISNEQVTRLFIFTFALTFQFPLAISMKNKQSKYTIISLSSIIIAIFIIAFLFPNTFHSVILLWAIGSIVTFGLGYSVSKG